jgi:hypothetical protein
MQFLAIYCLIALYHATHVELESIKPLRKFVLIKMVVFFTFWQGFLLSILGYFKLIGKEQWTVYDNKQLSSGIQDVIICIECLPAALMFAVAYPARDYARPGEGPGSVLENIVNMFDVRDLGRDVSALVEEEVCSKTFKNYCVYASVLCNTTALRDKCTCCRHQWRTKMS